MWLLTSYHKNFQDWKLTSRMHCLPSCRIANQEGMSIHRDELISIISRLPFVIRKEASSKQNHLVAITSMCRRDSNHCMGQVFLLVAYNVSRPQKFIDTVAITICDQKG